MSKQSTTPDRVELTRRAFEAVNRRDLDAVMSFYAPDALLDVTRELGTELQGWEAIRGFLEDWMGAYDEVEWVPGEPVDLGNGVLFEVVHQKGRPVGVTGVVHQSGGWFFVWVDGLIASHTIYPEDDIDEARAAAERLAEERA
jgi:ketosteroid isomerase-like protein